MEKEHQETTHQPEAELVPEVIEEGEENTKEETEESICNNKLKKHSKLRPIVAGLKNS